MSTKITKATFKSFIRKNAGSLYVMNLSDFDPMTDCVQQTETAGFRKAESIERASNHTLGISGVWLVGHSDDSFTAYEKDGFRGIEVYNSCGNFVVAIREAKTKQEAASSASWRIRP